MRLYPTLDEEREQELAALVRDVAGPACSFHDDGPQIVTAVLAEMWTHRADEMHAPAAAAFLAAMAMATDGLRAANRCLYRCDFGGLWVELRRSQELYTLAIALAMEPALADGWLSGKEVSQQTLRKSLKGSHLAVVEKLETTYRHLSNEAHGRAQALSAYEDSTGHFSWPVEAADVDKRHVWAAHLTYCAYTLAHMGALHWMGRGWGFLRPDLRKATESYYNALGRYMQRFKNDGNWWMLAPSEIRGWLLEAYGTSWEERALNARRSEPAE